MCKMRKIHKTLGNGAPKSDFCSLFALSCTIDIIDTIGSIVLIVLIVYDI